MTITPTHDRRAYFGKPLVLRKPLLSRVSNGWFASLAKGLAHFGDGASAVAIGLLLPLSVLALWSVAARNEWMSPQILPAPALVWETASDLISTGQLQAELLVSVGRVLAGLFIGGTIGAAFGILVGLSPRAEAYLMPVVRAIWSVPSLGWLPVCMLVFGIGETLKIILISKGCFLPLMLNSFEGVRNVPAKYRDVARIFELNRFDTLRYVILPATMPSLLNGLRLSLSKGWQVLVLVEMIASSAGIGYLMTWGRKSFQLDVVLTTIVVIGIVGWTFDRLALFVQERGTGWVQRSVA